MASGTAFDFSFPPAQPILSLDDSELENLGKDALKNKKKGLKLNKELCIKPARSQLSPSFIPQSVLFGSLLEHLCSLYESDKARSKQLFDSICKQLEKIDIVSPVIYLEEYASVRLQYKEAFYDLIRSSILNLDSKLKLPPSGENNALLGNGLLKIKTPKFSTSRYEEEYEELSEIGKGAFGSVFKARNLMDNQEYAIKKIRFKDADAHEESQQIKRIMREVQSLASLQSAHIVRYHYAWMEHRYAEAAHSSSDVSSSAFNTSSKNKSAYSGNHLLVPSVDSQFDSEPKTNDSCLSWASSEKNSSASNVGKQNGKFWQLGDDDSMSASSNLIPQRKNKISEESNGNNLTSSPPNDVIFTEGVLRGEKSMKRVKSVILTQIPQGPLQVQVFNKGNFIRSKSLVNMQDMETCKEGNTRIPLTEPVNTSIPTEIVLFIQMQLCESSLKTWLVERNKSLRDPLCIDVPKSLDISRQVLQALDYIHGKDILHRDLKPRNILLIGQRPHVLLGDFGLARPSLSRHASEVMTPVEELSVGFELDEHTSGVGTTVYAAPEQLGKDYYDFKADMYSFGIIFFELMWPMSMGHERGNMIRMLRSNEIPAQFAETWPSSISILKSLISHDPDDRPSAHDLLGETLFLSSHGKIIASKDTEIKGLQKANRNLQWQNSKLRKENSDLKDSLQKCYLKLAELGIDPTLL